MLVRSAPQETNEWVCLPLSLSTLRVILAVFIVGSCQTTLDPPDIRAALQITGGAGQPGRRGSQGVTGVAVMLGGKTGFGF